MDSSPVGNVGSTERWASMAAGLGLALAALSGRGPLRRLALGTAGLSLLSRGATGYCAVRAALNGQTTLAGGIGEQFRRLAGSLGMGDAAGTSGTGALGIDSLDSMYAAEVHELASAERQLRELLEEVSSQVEDDALRTRLLAYATEVHSRERDLQRIALGRPGATNAPGREDDAMRALVAETRKMARIPRARLRDAAVLASIQRIVHYRIAGYGIVAAYAKSLDAIPDASRFAEYADRDREIDEELTSLAEDHLNARAGAGTAQPDAKPAGVAEGTRPLN